FALAEIGEDEAEIFDDRIGGDAHLGGEGGLLRRLQRALAAALELPAMIEAADLLADDPAQRKLGLAMRAAILQQEGRAALAAIERVMLIEGEEAHRPPFLEIERAVDRLPEASEPASGERAGAGMGDIDRSGLVHSSSPTRSPASHHYRLPQPARQPRGALASRHGRGPCPCFWRHSAILLAAFLTLLGWGASAAIRSRPRSRLASWPRRSAARRCRAPRHHAPCRRKGRPWSGAHRGRAAGDQRSVRDRGNQGKRASAPNARD